MRTGARLLLRVAGAALVVVVVVVLVPGLLLGGLLVLGSVRTIYERAGSSNGWNEARVQFDDGGAVSSFSRLVFVKSRLNPSDEPLLSCRAFWGEGEAAVHLRWLDEQRLLIRHAFAAVTSKRSQPIEDRSALSCSNPTTGSTLGRRERRSPHYLCRHREGRLPGAVLATAGDRPETFAVSGCRRPPVNDHDPG